MTTSDAATTTEPAGPLETPAAAPQPIQPLRWAVVEMMGHQRVAGRIDEATVGGITLLQVHVPQVALTPPTLGFAKPEVETIPAHSVGLTAAAIFRVNWCDEAAAQATAQRIAHRPPGGNPVERDHAPAR